MKQNNDLIVYYVFSRISYTILLPKEQKIPHSSFKLNILYSSLFMWYVSSSFDSWMTEFVVKWVFHDVIVSLKMDSYKNDTVSMCKT